MADLSLLSGIAVTNYITRECKDKRYRKWIGNVPRIPS